MAVRLAATLLAVLFTLIRCQSEENDVTSGKNETAVDLKETGHAIAGALKDITNVEVGLAKMQIILESVRCPSSDNDVDSHSKVIDPPSFVYHRLDYLVSPPRLCKYFKQLATLDTSALFLSAQCFKPSVRFISDEEDSQAIQRFIAYMNDHTKLLSNPGLKTNIRKEALTIARITSTWKSQAQSGKLAKYAVRRYVGTKNGAFLVYPGTAIERSYEPTSRDWFRNALSSPGKLVFTAPYLDVGGAGYIVTLSHTVHDRCVKTAKTDSIVGVMGIDFTLGYFHKLLMESIETCRMEHVTCFIMDEKGYLVAHPGLVEPAGHGPVEYTHIVHKEAFVANDLLNHKNFVRKNICNSFSDSTIQRFYNFNTSLEGVLTNLVHGAQCAKYQISSIPGTNVFIGIVNQTCDTITAFCPCSMTDRLCLNCHRMEQTDCECPCECPLEANPGKAIDEELIPGCAPYPEEMSLPLLKEADNVPSCFQVDCSLRTSETDCQGVLGCEWCQLYANGTALENKFCNYQRECFGGVLGVRTPYVDEVLENHGPAVQFPRASPYISIIVMSFICIALFTCFTFCFRNHVHGVSGPLYITGSTETNARVFQLDNEPEDIEHHTINLVSQKTVLLASFDNPAVVSPYRANPSYRRPPGAESDHGYSTMTQQEESQSERMGPTFEPLLSKDKHRVPTSAQSLTSTSRASSPLHLPCKGRQHSLPSQNILRETTLAEVPQDTTAHVLADVQVHIVDSH
ncbi:VWFA and cache domain-containing protein 1 [Halotydeus destructor]|nr:VWFA and cache domain-containing protein 1 [Halotydeus destructor]